jgi:hypothetical protein
LAIKAGQLKVIILANLRASPAKSVALGALALILIVLLIRQFADGAQNAEAEEGVAVAIVPAAPTVPVPPATEKPRRKPRPNVARMPRRNPFSLATTVLAGAADETDDPAGQPALPESLKLNFTITGGDDGRPKAVISGIVVRPGTIIAGFTVEEIHNRRVVLNNGEQRLTLTMP